jgi:hypothetical protein
MNDKFDELTKQMTQSVTRRGALKKFGVGLASMALACFGLAKRAEAQSTCRPNGYQCINNSDCCSGNCQLTDGYQLGSHKKSVSRCAFRADAQDSCGHCSARMAGEALKAKDTNKAKL